METKITSNKINIKIFDLITPKIDYTVKSILPSTFITPVASVIGIT